MSGALQDRLPVLRHVLNGPNHRPVAWVRLHGWRTTSGWFAMTARVPIARSSQESIPWRESREPRRLQGDWINEKGGDMKQESSSKAWRLARWVLAGTAVVNLLL